MAIHTSASKHTSRPFSSYERIKPLADYHNQPIPPHCRLDYGLYTQLLAHRSHSGTKAQAKYVSWLQSYIRANVTNVTTKLDKAGNLYVTKGKTPIFPAFVSHVDINQQRNEHVSPVKAHNWITGLDTSTGERAGLGHDDKAGNLLALLALRHLPNVKCLFTTDEETGGQGAARADLSFFKDCAFVIQADRNAYAGPEFITYSGGTELCSEEFIAACRPTLDRYNFKTSRGVFTDVNVLKDGGLKISAVNITAGYFDEHRANESLYIPAFENSAAFAFELCSALAGEVWPHLPPVPIYEPYQSYDWRAEMGAYTEQSKTGKPAQSHWSHADWHEPLTHWPAPAKSHRWAAADPCLCSDCGEWIEYPEVINGFIPCPHCLAWIADE